MALKRCPNCGGTKLLATVVRGAQVESLENGEFKILVEGKTAQVEIVGCANKVCSQKFDESALVEMIPCKKCGTLTEPGNIDANGECDVCRALVNRPDLVNASKEDIIRMYLKLEQNVHVPKTISVPSPVVTSAPEETTPELVKEKVEEKIEESTEESNTEVVKAEDKMKIAQQAIQNASNEIADEIVEAVTEVPSETAEEPKPTTTKKRKVKKTPEEPVVAQEEPTQEQVDTSANAMAESQEAPFPDQDDALKDIFQPLVPEEPTSEQVEQAQPTEPFQMFEAEQSF